MISHKRLLELISYNPATGIFRHLGTGKVAGTPFKNGRYLGIRLDGKVYLAHRLAWFYMNQKWPIVQIDHVDNVGRNNRISNLREATCSQNRINSGAQKTSSSGIRGVHYAKHAKKFRAQCVKNGKTISLGYYESAIMAQEAYAKAVIEIHGVFAERHLP